MGSSKFPDRPLWIAVLVSWGIAFVEYCFAGPANRIGYTVYSAVLYLNEAIRLNHVAAFGCLVLALVVDRLRETQPGDGL